MSADHGYRLNQAALLAEAPKLDACEAFEVEAGGSHHHCGVCGQGLAAHVAVALRAEAAKSCEGCAHGEPMRDLGPEGMRSATWCTRPAWPWNGKLLPIGAKCEAWEAIDHG